MVSAARHKYKEDQSSPGIFTLESVSRPLQECFPSLRSHLHSRTPQFTMFPSSALLSLALLAVSSVSASPIKRDANKFSLAFAARFNATGSQNVAEADRARAAALRKNASSKNGKRDGAVSVANTAVTYTASVGVGSPATQCQSPVLFLEHLF